MKPTLHPRQQGYVLLAVISILTVIATLGAYTLTSARLDAALSRAEVDTARARVGIRAGVTRAVFLLGQPDGFVADGRLLEFQLDDLQIRVRLVADQGLVGLNSADGELLELFISKFAPIDTDARALADAILDWRDADQDPRPRGSEKRDYAALGMVEPANRPFVHVAELRRVMGMDDALYAALSPWVSVTMKQAKPNPDFAPEALLELLDLTPSEIANILDDREAGRPGRQTTPATEDVNETKTTEPVTEDETVENKIYMGFVEVITDTGTARSEKVRIDLDADTGQFELYGRQVIDYGSMDQYFSKEAS